MSRTLPWRSGGRRASVVWRMGAASGNNISLGSEATHLTRDAAALTTTTCSGIHETAALERYSRDVSVLHAIAFTHVDRPGAGRSVVGTRVVQRRPARGRTRDRPRSLRLADVVAADDVRESRDSRLALAVPARAARADQLCQRVSRDRRGFRGHEHSAGARRRGHSPLLSRATRTHERDGARLRPSSSSACSTC